MDRKSWFVDFAKSKGRRNCYCYGIGVIKAILCDDRDNPAKQVEEIADTLRVMDEIFDDRSLPWDVDGETKKPSAPTEDQKEKILNLIIPQNKGMQLNVKQAFKILRDELLIAMARDRTAPKDVEIYGHIHSHVFNLEVLYEDILSDKGR